MVVAFSLDCSDRFNTSVIIVILAIDVLRYLASDCSEQIDELSASVPCCLLPLNLSCQTDACDVTFAIAFLILPSLRAKLS